MLSYGLVNARTNTLGIKMIRNVFKHYTLLPFFVLATGILSSSYCGAMLSSQKVESQPESAEDKLKAPGIKKPLLTNTLPNHWPKAKREAAFHLLNNQRLTLMEQEPAPGETSPSSQVSAASAELPRRNTRSFGFSYPPNTPWQLLVMEYVKNLTESNEETVFVGDWGAGQGVFSLHACMAGARVKAIEQSRLNAQLANNTTIPRAKQFLPEGQRLKDTYSVTHGSVVTPPRAFLDRHNHVNAVFNVIPHLTPEETTVCVQNVFSNTLPGGVAIFVVETPYTQELRAPVNLKYYNENRALGKPFPGYGVYTHSSIRTIDEGKEIRMPRSVYEPTPDEIKENKFPMGTIFSGHCKDSLLSYVNPQDNGGMVMQLNPNLRKDDPENILKHEGVLYTYHTSHLAQNLMDYPELAALLEKKGFCVVNGYYTDNFGDTLYPNDIGNTMAPTTGKFQRSRVVVIAKRPNPEGATS